MTLAVATFALLLPAFSADLTVAAQVSGRPRECVVDAARDKRPTIWERARTPDLRRYCDELARGFGRLGVAPEEARAIALESAKLGKDRAAPFVLLGRAELALGERRGALVAFERALALDDRSLEEPGAMHDWALALAHAGRQEEALSAYRTLLPRVALLAGADRRVRVLLEAAELSLLSRGQGGLDEAIALLGQARREPIREAQPRVLATLALALDRKGEDDRALALLDEVLRRGGLDAVSAFPSDGLGSSEGEAMMAFVAEASQPAEASRRWEQYLARSGEGSPFREHARKRLDKLRGGRARAR